MSNNVFVISPYHTGSHKSWLDGYVKYSQHPIQALTMAGRFWKWRMQGGVLEQAQQIQQAIAALGQPDALLVTDMVNLPALLALTKDLRGETPVAMYCHENQLTYPPPPGEKVDLSYGMINTLSMMAAEVIAFNSSYHLETFFDELPRLLKHFPDYNHLEIVAELHKKAIVLPVGIDFEGFDIDMVSPEDRPLRIVWNQRWEYDKNPGSFFQTMNLLHQHGLSFELVIAGENFRRQPSEFDVAREVLAEHIVHFGYVETRKDYISLLRSSDIVISTAHHEFFGVSILEAIYAGCYPLLPDRLSYPELVPEREHTKHLYHSREDLMDKLIWCIQHPAQVRTTNLRPIAAAYAWPEMAPRYDAMLGALASM